MLTKLSIVHCLHLDVLRSYCYVRVRDILKNGCSVHRSCITHMVSLQSQDTVAGLLSYFCALHHHNIKSVALEEHSTYICDTDIVRECFIALGYVTFESMSLSIFLKGPLDMIYHVTVQVLPSPYRPNIVLNFERCSVH